MGRDLFKREEEIPARLPRGCGCRIPPWKDVGWRPQFFTVCVSMDLLEHFYSMVATFVICRCHGVTDALGSLGCRGSSGVKNVAALPEDQFATQSPYWVTFIEDS